MNYSRWLPLLAAGCLLLGCADGPQQVKGSWPWEYGRQDGRYPTGDYATVSGTVANFGDAPKAVKPVTPEVREAPAPAGNPPGGAAAAPPAGTSAVDKINRTAKREYDFAVNDAKVAQPSYLPQDTVRAAYDIIAYNRGDAPVSVAIGSDPATWHNIATDKTLPFAAVIPPHTDQPLVHVSAKIKNQPCRFGYRYRWSIGDVAARHLCPEQYRFPFDDKIRAYAGVTDATAATPFTRFAVVFHLPAATPVLAARKGRVVRIAADDKIDILHDDRTIATYSHLDGIGAGITVGKDVAAGAVIGIAGAAGADDDAYVQFAVWRPEPRSGAAPTVAGFDLVSFPLAFCPTDSTECKVLTQSQWLERDTVPEVKRQGRRGAKGAVRKDGA